MELIDNVTIISNIMEHPSISYLKSSEVGDVINEALL